MKCPSCDATISEALPTAPIVYCEQEFCSARCAQRWAYVQLPQALAKVEQSRFHLRKINHRARGLGRELARAALRELRDGRATENA